MNIKTKIRYTKLASTLALLLPLTASAFELKPMTETFEPTGRGVNRTADTPVEVDLLTDVVLPVTVHEVLQWDDIRPTRHDAMLAAGVVLENAADMAKAFPELWPSHDAARQQKARRLLRGICGCPGAYRDGCVAVVGHGGTERG